jgi:hypothetical protein
VLRRGADLLVMNLGRFFARLSMYRAARSVPMWVLVALAVVFYLLAGIGKAEAHEHNEPIHGDSCLSFGHNCSQEQAWRACGIRVDNLTTVNGPAGWSFYCAAPAGFNDRTQSRSVSPSGTDSIERNYLWTSGHCSAGSSWDQNANGCQNDNERCLNKNDAISNPAAMVGAYGNCFDGCRIGQRTDDIKKTGTVEVAGAPASLAFGSIGYTGETCSSNDPLPEFKDNTACTMVTGATAGNQTVCVRPDGRHCYAKDANNVTTFCWQPGEVGEQFADNVIQKREPGDKTQNPTPPTPPEGDTLNQDGPATKTTTTINNTTSTTTVTNYSTGSGASPRPGTGTGVPGDGSGDGPGTGDGDSNSVGGSGDCTAGWQASGDAILGAILGELWQTRCAGEGKEGDNASDAGSFGDAADAMEVDPAGFFGEGSGGSGIDEGWFTFGGATCPSFPNIEIPGTGQSWVPPPELCSAIQGLGLLFTLIAYVWALRIVGS